MIDHVVRTSGVPLAARDAEERFVAAVFGLRFRYPEVTRPAIRTAVRWLLNIESLRLQENTAYSVLGENMVGKTTLLRLLTGTLDRPSHGCIGGSFQYGDTTGRFPLDAQTARSAGVCAVHQNDPMFDDLSIWENVVLGAPSDAAIRRHAGSARALLTSVLAELAGDEVHSDAMLLATLSAGGRAMVRMIRAVAWGYRLLVLDEPTVNLDPSNRDRWFSLLAKLWATPASVLLVSHDPADHRTLRDLAVASGREHHQLRLHGGTLQPCA